MKSLTQTSRLKKKNKIKRKHVKGNTQKKNSQLYLHLCVSILLSFISSECSKILSLIIYFLLQGLPFKGCSAKNKFLVFLHLRMSLFSFHSWRIFFTGYSLQLPIPIYLKNVVPFLAGLHGFRWGILCHLDWCSPISSVPFSSGYF